MVLSLGAGTREKRNTPTRAAGYTDAEARHTGVMPRYMFAYRCVWWTTMLFTIDQRALALPTKNSWRNSDVWSLRVRLPKTPAVRLVMISR